MWQQFCTSHPTWFPIWEALLLRGDPSMVVILARWYVHVSDIPSSLLRFMHYSFSFHWCISHLCVTFIHCYSVAVIYCSCVAVIYRIWDVALISHLCSVPHSRRHTYFSFMLRTYFSFMRHTRFSFMLRTHCSCTSLLVWNIPDQSIFLACIKTSTPCSEDCYSCIALTYR